MPEGPEVRRITDHLENHTKDVLLVSIDGIDSRYSLGGSQFRGAAQNLLTSLAKKPLPIRVNCKGKFIYWIVDQDDNPFVIFQTLGMSGGWRTRKPSKHHRLTFVLQQPNGTKSIHYKDARCFGTFIIHEGEVGLEALDKKLDKELGPDLLEGLPSFGSDERYDAIQIFRKKNKHNITKVLMNQKVFAGIGNYLKAEILHECKLSPRCKIEHLTDDDLWNLYTVARWHICAAYAAKGASFRDYKMPDGSLGTKQYKFKVYRRKVCSCGTRVTREKTPDKRTTWWCENCQIHPILPCNQLIQTTLKD
jgi:formamidopyrimidine-DNA glycosylase